MSRITEKGIKLLNQVHPEVKVLGNYFSSALTNSEKRTLSNLLEKIYGMQVE